MFYSMDSNFISIYKNLSFFCVYHSEIRIFIPINKLYVFEQPETKREIFTLILNLLKPTGHVLRKQV